METKEQEEQEITRGILAKRSYANEMEEGADLRKTTAIWRG